MKRKRMILGAAFLLSLILLLLSLSACGRNPASGPDTAENQSGQPDMAADAGENNQPTEIREIENNGGWFVRADGNIYFRAYGPDAFEKTALFGQFLEDFNITGRDSDIMRYDLTTRKVEKVFTDTGYGKIYIGDGGFYLQERLNGKDAAVWYSLDGKESKKIADGKILGFTDGGLLAIEDKDINAGTVLYQFYHNGEPMGYNSSSAFGYTCVGVSDDGIFLLYTDYHYDPEADESQPLVRTLWQMEPDAEENLIYLGTLPATEYDDIYDAEPERFITGENQIGLTIGYYAGTGHFLNDWIVITAVPGEEMSLKVFQSAYDESDSEFDGEESESDEEFLTPSLAMDENGELILINHASGELMLDWNDEGGYDLRLYDGFDWELLKENLCPARKDGFGYHKITQSMEYIDGSVYITMALAHASPLNDIGWREAYEILDMLYLVIPASQGQEQELARVDHDALFQGRVWFADDRQSVYWQQTTSDPEAYDTEAGYLYQIPIASDAEWYAPGMERADAREAILSDAVFASDAGIDINQPDYYGYALPEDKSGEWLFFKLNPDGEIVFLTEKSPDALLSVQIGVAEDDLKDCAEKLNLTPRRSDEDTVWYWARLTALEDDVNIILDRTAEEQNTLETLAGQDGMFIPGELLLSRVLNRGESVGVRVSLPWHPEIRVSAIRHGAYGEYIFGEDNFLRIYPEENQAKELTLAGYPFYEDGFPWTGKWFYRDINTGACTAEVDLVGDWAASVKTDDSVYDFGLELDDLYAKEGEVMDVIRFVAEDAETVAALNGMSGSVGDYRMERFRTDGETILRLVQANNGDAALDMLIPSQNQWNTDFVLHLYGGAAENAAPLRNVILNAEIVKADRERNLIWLQEARRVDAREDGSLIYAINPAASCVSCPAKSPDLFDAFAAYADPAYPMAIVQVTVDRDGNITSLREI